MTRIRSRTDRRNPDSIKSGGPFIGLEQPFVGYNTPYIPPFVGEKLPFVTNRGKQCGFTLIELMTTLIVLGILSALAVPAMRDIIMNNRIATESNDMLVSLMFARSEAIKRSAPVILCKSLDPAAAVPACDGTAANPWTSGWLVYADINGNGGFDVGELLRIGDGFGGTGNAIKTSNATIQNQIGFNRLGLLTSAGGDFYICDSRGNNFARVISVLNTGRVRIDRDATAAC